jgi:hypothetical protein
VLLAGSYLVLRERLISSVQYGRLYLFVNNISGDAVELKAVIADNIFYEPYTPLLFFIGWLIYNAYP